MTVFSASDALRHQMRNPNPTVRPPKGQGKAPSDPAIAPLTTKPTIHAPDKQTKPRRKGQGRPLEPNKPWSPIISTCYPIPNENKPDSKLPHSKPQKQARALDSDRTREAQGAGCPLVRITLCRARLLDVDAKYGSVKDLLDGLQYAGLIRGDREGEIRLEVHQEKVSKLSENTMIEIEY